jgi:succinate-acetate transporter protein
MVDDLPQQGTPSPGAQSAAAPHGPIGHLMANPVPVGVAGFSLTVFALGLYTSGQFDAKGEILIYILAAAYGGLTQFIAGFFALRRGDIFPAAFMTTYGAFWFTYVALNVYVVPHAGSAASQAVTIYLIMWTVISFIFLVTTLWTNWVVVTAFVVLFVAFILLDIGSAASNVTVNHVAGYLEMVLGAIGWYIVLGELVNDTSGRAILPFPLTPLHNLPTVSGEPQPNR